jgi:hypothetical protein
MGFNGSGGYNRVHNWVNDKNADIKIRSDRMDAEFDDFASAMELCLLKDGQQNPTANLPMNGKKHTGVSACSARTEYMDGATYQDGGFVWAGVASGTSAITVGLNPPISAYVTGMKAVGIAAGDNASAVTWNVDGVSAAALVKGKNTPLDPLDIVSGMAIWAVYKGADGWQMLNPTANINSTNIGASNPGTGAFTTLTTTGAATFGADVTISGQLVAGGLSYPTTDGAQGQSLTTDGSGNLSFSGAGRVLLATVSASAASSIFFATAVDFTVYDNYKVEWTDIIPTTSAINYYIRTSPDGSAVDSSANDYSYAYRIESAEGASSHSSDAAQIDLRPVGSIGWWDATGDSLNGVLTIASPSSSSNTKISFEMYGENANGGITYITGGGKRNSAAAVNGIELRPSTGNISGKAKCYGVL